MLNSIQGKEKAQQQLGFGSLQYSGARAGGTTMTQDKATAVEGKP